MVLLPAVGVVSMSVAASAAAACPEQCSLNGMCLPSGACQCDTPWTGANCGVLERLAVNATQQPGAAIFGYSPVCSSRHKLASTSLQAQGQILKYRTYSYSCKARVDIHQNEYSAESRSSSR
jgi:hypothetical protein